MSKDNVKKFFEEFENNPALKEKFLNAVKENHKEARRQMAVKMVDFAKASGFSFAEDDLIELQTDLMDNANNNGELDDADLMKAAGGTSAGPILLSIFSFGIGCAVVSFASEAAKKGACGDYFKK